MICNRLLFSLHVLFILFLSLLFVSSSYAQLSRPLVTGSALAGLEQFDEEVLKLMQNWNIPGASLAVAKDSRLILARGYGVASSITSEPVTPQTLFRMGSITKAVTVVAVMRLVEQGKLKLDEPVTPYLAKVVAKLATVKDPRATAITVRHLLQHTGGMDRDQSGDPFFMPHLQGVSRRQGVAPVTCEAIIKDTLEQPLSFMPGERYAYSNVGFCMLGRIVEAVTGESYAKYVSRTLMQPVLGKEYLLGRTIEPISGESSYHVEPEQRSVMPAPGVTALFGVSAPRGSYNLESMDSLGAWVATPTEVLKFFLAIDGARGSHLLSTDTMAQLLQEPTYLINKEERKPYRSLGLQVIKTSRGYNWWHTGTQPGVASLALRAANGWSWVIVFNGRGSINSRNVFFSEFEKSLWRAALSIKMPPVGDLFEPISVGEGLNKP